MNPQTTKYACPMHPEVTDTKPGKCPKCGMNLEPVKSTLMEACTGLKAASAYISIRSIVHAVALSVERGAVIDRSLSRSEYRKSQERACGRIISLSD